MKKQVSILIIIITISISCSQNNDPNKIVQQVKFAKDYPYRDVDYYIGRRSDGLANFYTITVSESLFHNDTVRNYLLSNWQNIEYWDGSGGYFLFKDITDLGNDGFKLKLSELKNLSDEYLNNEIQKAKIEQQKYKAEHFSAYDMSDDEIWNYIQGEWRKVQTYSSAEYYLRLTINGSSFKIEQFIQGYVNPTYNLDNVDSAPFELLYSGKFTGEIKRLQAEPYYGGYLTTNRKHIILPTDNPDCREFGLVNDNNNKVYFLGEPESGNEFYWWKGGSFKTN